MVIESKNINDVKIISVFGKVGFENSAEFRDALMEDLLEINDLILDFTNLTYLNSIGLGIIVKTYTKASSEGKKFTICGMNEDIRKLFSITKLDNLIEIKENLDDALKFLNRM